MVYQGLRFEDRLDSASNFCSWRERIGVVLEEQGVWEFMDNVATASSDPQQLAQHNKRDAKARRIHFERSQRPHHSSLDWKEDNQNYLDYHH